MCVCVPYWRQQLTTSSSSSSSSSLPVEEEEEEEEGLYRVGRFIRHPAWGGWCEGVQEITSHFRRFRSRSGVSHVMMWRSSPCSRRRLKSFERPILAPFFFFFLNSLRWLIPLCRIFFFFFISIYLWRGDMFMSLSISCKERGGNWLIASR